MTIKWAAAFVAALAIVRSAVAAPVEEPAGAPTLEVRVPHTDGKRVDPQSLRGWREWLLQRGFSVDRCGTDSVAGTLVLDIERTTDLQVLADAGFTVLRKFEPAPLEGDLRVQSEYYDPSEIVALLDQTYMDHPNITSVFTIGTSYQGRPIKAIEISDHPGMIEDEPAIQFNAQHHAREVITSHIVADVINQLTDNYGIDPEITAWVNNYKTVCVPMVNPDGVQYVFSVNGNWRKNRRNYGGSCIGVDNNRNYPYLWGPGCGSSGTCTSDIYRGPSSASELETKAMTNLTNQYHFVMATSYHSYGNFIDYPYACSNGSPSGQMPEHPVINEMMIAMANAITAVDGVTYTANTPVPAGGVNGDDTSWYYAHMGVYPFIVEVGSSFEPAWSTVAGHINRNRAGWKYLYRRLGQARIDLHVTGNCTPIQAEVTLTNYVYDTGELPRVTSLPYGRWSFAVPANGTYTVRVSESGYFTQDIPVSVGTTPVAVTVRLVPTTGPLVPGDMNLDSIIDGADIQFFLDTLLEGSSAAPTMTARGDFNFDCLLDSQDVAPFVDALLGN